MYNKGRETHITTGKVTTLEHKIRDDTVEFRSFVTKALLACAQRTEVLSGFGDYVIVEREVDAAGLIWDRFSD